VSAHPARTDHLGRPRLGDVLLRLGLLDHQRLAAAFEARLATGGATPLSRVVVDLGLVEESDLARALAVLHVLPLVELDPAGVDPEAVRAVPRDLAERSLAVPFAWRGTARERWLAQRGRSGVLHSGHWLIDHRGGRLRGATGRASHATVHFADDIEADEIDAYIATGEPLKVAGAFTIDSKGAGFIDRIEGDPHTVVGLSVPLLRKLVHELGGRWTDLWNR